MSIDIDFDPKANPPICDVTIRCDDCARAMHDGDRSYCSSCASHEECDFDTPHDALREWIDGESLTLAPHEERLLRRVADAMESGRPLSMMRPMPTRRRYVTVDELRAERAAREHS